MPPRGKLRLRDPDVASEAAVFQADGNGYKSPHDPAAGIAESQSFRILSGEAYSFNSGMVRLEVSRGPKPSPRGSCAVALLHSPIEFDAFGAVSGALGVVAEERTSDPQERVLHVKL